MIPKGYKNTAIGIIPEEWEVRKIKEIGIVHTGNTPPTSDSSNYGDEFLFVSPADLGSEKYITHTEKRLSEKGFSISRKFPKGSVLFTCIGSTIGKIGIASEDLTSNQQINAVIVDKNNNYEFVYYQLNSNSERIKLIAANQAVPIINKSQFESVKIIQAPLPEQRAIAQVLSTWDKAIEQYQALLQQYELRKKWLMQNLLTGKKRLKGFEGDVNITVVGKYLKEISTRNKSLRVKNVLSVTNTKGFVNQEQQFDRAVASKNTSNYKVIKKGQFAYNPSRVNVGSLDLLSNFEKGILSPMYVVFETNEKYLLSSYFYYLLNTHWFYGHIPMFVQGSVRDSLSFDGLCSMRFFIPDIEEQTAIANILQTADKEIELIKDKIEKLQKQKKGLMQQLLTGRKRIKNYLN